MKSDSINTMSDNKDPEEVYGPNDNIIEVCPDCGMPAKLIANRVIEGKILVSTFRCPNGHRFSLKIDLK